ncbi:site-2 protease family protein [Desulfurococcus mucosus]|uniref:Peptidase M50 n=1 Tax=Desulfurococcus mucosus (strain ATCC 35584 / DSM 2162 / JCM 9187 / O7/1) TaxID=765177 RepID=E8RA11_DESM0|nr:site-2 protease family protein [Desulfurococcus mucosus]ADV65337.1 peptidase M50 [Desulfurococcus mucosus DSM 2162]
MKWFSRAGISVVESREFTVQGKRVVDLVLVNPVDEELFNELYTYLSGRGIQLIQLKTEKPVVRLIEADAGRSRFKLALTMASLITIGLTGYGLSESFLSLGGRVADTVALAVNTLAYTLIFALVLLTHEFGHIYISRRSGVRIDGPILLPAPPIQLGFLGTFGAVIYMRTLPPSRRELAKLGVSGPLTGFIAATIVGVVGLYMSPVIPVEQAAEMMGKGELTPTPVSSLMLQVITLLRPGNGGVIVMHPLLFIAYIMYLITFLNLLPIGQLDGGHVVRSFTNSETHRRLGSLTVMMLLAVGTLLFLLGSSAYSFYLSLGAVAALLYLVVARGRHPGYANQYDESDCRLCLALYLLLVVLTTPIPLW